MADERAVELADQIAEAGFYAAAFKMRALAEQNERLRSERDRAREVQRKFGKQVGELQRALRVAQGEAKMLRDTCPYKAAVDALVRVIEFVEDGSLYLPETPTTSGLLRAVVDAHDRTLLSNSTTTP